MARILTPTVLRPAALALLLFVVRGQEVVTQAPGNQTTVVTTNETTTEMQPAAQAPTTNQTATTGNQTAGGRPSAMSQLEVRRLG